MSMHIHPLAIFALSVLPTLLWYLGHALLHGRIRLRGGRMVYVQDSPVLYWALVGCYIWGVSLMLVALMVFLYPPGR